jgi:hypothetical protein
MLGVNISANTKRAYVPTSALAKSVTFDDAAMHVSLLDGRSLSVPLLSFPTLNGATPEQRARYEIATRSLAAASACTGQISMKTSRWQASWPALIRAQGKC